VDAQPDDDDIDLDAAIAAARERHRAAEKANHRATEGEQPKPNDQDDGEAILLKCGTEITMRAVDWHWRGWLARGKFHLLAGSKSAGKSTIAYDLMATTSIGGRWPDGTQADPGDVLVWSGEDDIADTIMPRYVASGGDPHRIYFIDGVMATGGARPFDPSTDITALIERARYLPDLKFVLIDPVVLAIPSKTDSHKNSETRRGLQPLVDFAEERNVVLLGITHFTKGTGDQDPVERVTGSLAFAALARIVLGASADEDGKQRRLVRISSNIGPSGGGIEYMLFQAPLPDYDFSAQRVAWGTALTGSAKELLNGSRRSAQADASTFLQEQLKDSGCPQREIKEAAEAHGHSWATVRLAQKKLGIKPRKDGKVWIWEMPPTVSTFRYD
jgi:putative DNA primase/helicase